jgi:hypothetical protein
MELEEIDPERGSRPSINNQGTIPGDQPHADHLENQYFY